MSVGVGWWVDKVVAIRGHPQNLKYSPLNPRAFTEHGAIGVA